MNKRIIEGACHCRHITYQLAWPAEDFPITKRECSCTFCRKHGASYTSHPDSELTIAVRDKDDITRYRFGHETADFIFCPHCGGMMFALCELDGTTYAVININHFENLNQDEMIHSQTDFDEEDIEGRLARRKRNWTPTVKFT